jgi:hypothetical protein
MFRQDQARSVLLLKGDNDISRMDEFRLQKLGKVSKCLPLCKNCYEM